MKRRTKKVLSLLLAASMVFTMNTIAFGEEIVAEDVAADEVVTEEVVNDDVAEVTEEVAAVEEADEAAEATLDEAELEDASLAGGVDYYEDGIGYNKDGVVTNISYATDGAKKNAVDSVATIKNTTSPVSWNNFYAADLIETVIEGSNKKDEYLNNKEKIGVSENNKNKYVENIFEADLDYQYGSIEVEDGVYLLYKYGTGDSAYVAGYDSFATKASNGADLKAIEYAAGDLTTLNTNIPNTGVTPTTDAQKAAVAVRDALYSRIGTLPYTTWDGRKIAWDKDGKYDATKTMKEDLKVKFALVKFEGDTVTELNGVAVSAVKIDAKALKNASIEYATTKAKVSTKFKNTNVDPAADVDAGIYVDEHKTMNTLPTFTVTLKASGKDVKSYAKKIKTAIKDQKFTFGIMQKPIVVNDVTTYVDETNIAHEGTFVDEYFSANEGDPITAKHWVAAENDDKAVKGYWRKANSTVHPASSNEITNDKNTGIQDKIEKLYEAGAYVDADRDDFGIGGLKIAKFSAKNDKPKATITDEVELVKKGVDNGTADITLKAGSGKDYEFEKISVAGESVFALNFTDGGNYVYAERDPNSNTTPRDLSVFGYKWAFRTSPVEKSKQFRYGIVANTDQGFVYSAE